MIKYNKDKAPHSNITSNLFGFSLLLIGFRQGLLLWLEGRFGEELLELFSVDDIRLLQISPQCVVTGKRRKGISVCLCETLLFVKRKINYIQSLVHSCGLSRGDGVR